MLGVSTLELTCEIQINERRVCLECLAQLLDSTVSDLVLCLSHAAPHFLCMLAASERTVCCFLERSMNSSVVFTLSASLKWCAHASSMHESAQFNMLAPHATSHFGSAVSYPMQSAAPALCSSKARCTTGASPSRPCRPLFIYVRVTEDGNFLALRSLPSNVENGYRDLHAQ